MNKINDKQHLNYNTFKKTCKEVGVPMKFFMPVIGLSSNAFSNWQNNEGRIPEQYQERLINALVAIKALREGYRLVPVKKTEHQGSEKKNIIQMIESAKRLLDQESGAYIKATKLLLDEALSEVTRVYRIKNIKDNNE